MLYFILLTALTVSIDSFFCGFSLAGKKSGKFSVVAIISLTVFVMSVIANYCAAFVSDYFSEKTANLGGVILIGVGIYNLIKKDDELSLNPIDNSKTVKQSFLTGFAVGLDGALANLSIALMGYNDFFVPFSIAAMHAIMISLGILLAGTRLVAKIDKFGFLPPLILIVLGLYKLTGFFI